MNAAPRPRKRFGQHFLACEDTIARIVGAIAPRAGDTLVEIGPGRGALTAPLAALASETGIELHAIEFDRDLVPVLRQQFASRRNVVIHEADALRFDFASLGPALRIVGNLPYNISTPLLFHLIGARDNILDMHLMLQKEVVDRLAADPGSRAFGRLTIMAGAFLNAERLFDVPPTAFRPPPRVVSTVLRLVPRREDAFDIDDPGFMRAIVTQAFSQRRKTLRNALKPVATEGDFAALGIDPGSRPEELPVATWVALANHLHAMA
jgi:16S rRNA (adenine1518-N6/adenine1519-N6)-dimethyltransferase